MCVYCVITYGYTTSPGYPCCNWLLCGNSVYIHSGILSCVCVDFVLMNSPRGYHDRPGTCPEDLSYYLYIAFTNLNITECTYKGFLHANYYYHHHVHINEINKSYTHMCGWLEVYMCALNSILFLSCLFNYFIDKQIWC